MGQVGQKAATIVVTLDSREVCAGTVLSGKIYLNVHKDVDNFTSVHITVCGSEVSKVHRKGLKKNDITKQKYKAASVFNFLNATHPLCEINGRMVKGNYEFPFQCQLPKDIPCSMSCTNTASDHCEISYHVDARMHRKGYLTWDVCDRCVFVVMSAPMIHPPSYTYLGPCSTPITTLGCYKRGKIMCGAYMSQNIFTPNSTVTAHHIVLNHSTAAITHIQISLSEKVEWKARYKNRIPRECDFERVLFKHVLCTSSLSGDDHVAPLARAVKDSQVAAFDEGLLCETIKRMIETKMRRGGDKWVLNIPSDILQTYQGRLINVSHVLRLECITASGNCNAVALKNIPVHRSTFPQYFLSNVLGESGVSEATPAGSVPSVDQRVHSSGACSALPPDWNPTLAPVTVIPEALCVQQVNFELFDFTNDDYGGTDTNRQAHADVCNPDVAVSLHNVETATPMEKMSFGDMLSALGHSFNRVQILEQWMVMHSEHVQNLSPTDIGMLFRTFPTEDSQLSVAEMIKRTRVDISCYHIAGAAGASLDVCRREVVVILCGMNIVDKENKGVVLHSVGSLEAMSVEQFFV